MIAVVAVVTLTVAALRVLIRQLEDFHMDKVQVPVNQGRLINAVANIGYDPEVALCDLMDNCLDAGANTIRVTLGKNTQADAGETDTICEYTIADDGSGMDRQSLVDAFTLGADHPRPPRALGKFGIGLKSAGLSLGRELVIITQPEGGPLLCARLSLSSVEESGQYEIDLGDVPTEYSSYSTLQEHGTILIIRDLNDNQPPHTKFTDYLRRYCAIVYHRFMERATSPLRIYVGGVELRPFDPLFLRDAEENGSLPEPRKWDGKTVHMLLASTLNIGVSAAADIAATHLVHPPSFQAEGKRKEMAARYAIDADPYTKRPRHGFYVYRNDRVIVLAERFHGLVGSQTQNHAFRARLMFEQTADTILSLDVKKRHCQLPSAARMHLRSMIAAYQRKSVEAWGLAGAREKERRGTTREERANSSIAKTPVTSLDYAPGSDLQDDATLAARADRQADISAQTVASIQDPTATQDVLNRRAKDDDIVTPVQGLKANAMWLPYPAVQYGKAETVVNKAHSWVAEAYIAAEREPGITVVLHHFFTILARAELEVRSTPWSDLTPSVLDKLFDRFRKKVSAIGEDLAEELEEALASDPEEHDTES